ncbi:MAG: hypothetical protein R3B06_11220 [Kofleriaceae bacterium]
MSERGPDLPRIPTIGWSWVVKIYLALALGAVAAFAAAGVLGWEFRDGVVDRAPGSARQSPGGYRTYHFWHSGYHGGK